VNESGEERLEDTLLDRAQQAVDAAAGIVARSEVVAAQREDLREGALTCRCAWCGRYRIGEARWVRVEPSAHAAIAQTTHGICDDCITILRESGLSA